VERYTGRIIILSGGEPLEDAAAIRLPDHDAVIAADSGLRHAVDLELAVDLVIGDMDSVDDGLLAAFAGGGTGVERYPVDKDKTDLELAVEAALGRGASRITILGAYTGRLDHLLGAMGLFAATIPVVDELVWTDGSTTVAGCGPRLPVSLDAAVGDRISLVSTGVDAVGVGTTGLHWNLTGGTLPAGSTRGLSNIVDARPVTISLTGGTLLVIHERTTR